MRLSMWFRTSVLLRLLVLFSLVVAYTIVRLSSDNQLQPTRALAASGMTQQVGQAEEKVKAIKHNETSTRAGEQSSSDVQRLDARNEQATTSSDSSKTRKARSLRGMQEAQSESWSGYRFKYTGLARKSKPKLVKGKQNPSVTSKKGRANGGSKTSVVAAGEKTDSSKEKEGVESMKTPEKEMSTSTTKNSPGTGIEVQMKNPMALDLNITAKTVNVAEAADSITPITAKTATSTPYIPNNSQTLSNVPENYSTTMKTVNTTDSIGVIENRINISNADNTSTSAAEPQTIGATRTAQPTQSTSRKPDNSQTQRQNVRPSVQPDPEAKPTPLSMKGKTLEEFNRQRYNAQTEEGMLEAYDAALYHIEDRNHKPEHTCKEPQPYVTYVSHPTKTYMVMIPNCVLLHQCHEFSGCCAYPYFVCGPSKKEIVHLAFLTDTMQHLKKNASPREALFLSFENHTQCSCQSKHQPARCLKDCPIPFEPRISGFSCLCDCLGLKGMARKYCERIEDGVSPMHNKGLECIKKGNCYEPKCTVGSFNVTTGFCPLSDFYALPAEAFKSNPLGQRQYRVHLKNLDHNPPPGIFKPNTTVAPAMNSSETISTNQTKPAASINLTVENETLSPKLDKEIAGEMNVSKEQQTNVNSNSSVEKFTAAKDEKENDTSKGHSKTTDSEKIDIEEKFASFRGNLSSEFSYNVEGNKTDRSRDEDTLYNGTSTEDPGGSVRCHTPISSKTVGNDTSYSDSPIENGTLDNDTFTEINCGRINGSLDNNTVSGHQANTSAENTILDESVSLQNSTNKGVLSPMKIGSDIHSFQENGTLTENISTENPSKPGHSEISTGSPTYTGQKNDILNQTVFPDIPATDRDNSSTSMGNRTDSGRENGTSVESATTEISTDKTLPDPAIPPKNRPSEKPIEGVNSAMNHEVVTPESVSKPSQEEPSLDAKTRPNEIVGITEGPPQYIDEDTIDEFYDYLAKLGSNAESDYDYEGS
ncbi:vascular endothelial growth factor a [Plakobranchus ocellatus]|uniref:Vascular endothelial growth factor a n=1 Tax=Plakobranchus ocellatus TaxID=259542 RepID=A0AAV3Y4T9_9GAST|nr:vascular endothelial growth factor a [Plakobranchus ocellatus]